MEMATESLKTLNFKGLCSVLGYEKDHPTRDSQVLMGPIAAFLEEYETGGTRIPPNETANPMEAQACAYSFLVEQNRAELLWPPRDGIEAGALVWERPEHQSMIIMAVAYIFRRRAFYNYQSRLKRGKKEGGQKPLARKKVAKRPRSPTSEDGSDSEDDGMLGVDPAYSLAPWTQPPKRFGRRRCIQYLRSIDPQKDSEDLTAFTVKWLAKADNPWPTSADNRLQIFMHEKNFYFSVDLKEDITRALINQLRRGTELEVDISGLQYSQFSKRVVDQIEYHTKQLTRNRFLEYELDGTPKKTQRFQHVWDDREEYWKGSLSYLGNEKPRKRSRTAKPAKEHPSTSPIIFPNLMRISPVEKPIADLRSMAISAQNQMIQNFASATEMETESTFSEVSSSSSPQSQTGECIKVETPAPYTTSYIDLITPESSRASTPEIELRTPIPVIAADLRSMARGAEMNQEPETPSTSSTEYRSANKDPEEDTWQSQGDDDPIWTEPVKDTGPILDANTPAARHSDSEEARPGSSNGTTHTLLQVSPLRPKTPPLSTATSLDWQSSASVQEPASRLIPTERTVPIPFLPPPTPTRSKSPSHSPSTLPLFPHDTRAQYKRDLTEFCDRNGASNASQPNPPPPIHTPIPPVSSISNPAMQTQTTFSSSLSPNTVWSRDHLGSQDNNVQVPTQPISHSSIVQGYPGARNVSIINVPMSPPTTPHFQAPPTAKHTGFIQDHCPTTFNPLQPTFSPVNRSRMAPPIPTVFPSSGSWTPSRSFNYQGPQTPQNREGNLQDSNFRRHPPYTPVQDITRNPPFPTPPSAQVLENQRYPSTPRQHGPPPYDPLVHNQQVYNLPHQNSDPQTSRPMRTLPSGHHQTSPIHIQVPGNHVPEKPFLAQNENAYSTPMNSIPSNSTNRHNLQSHPAPLNPRYKPQEIQAYPKQFCPNPTVQCNLPSTPASPIHRDGTFPTLPYPSQISLNTANKENTPQTPIYLAALHNETLRIPPQPSPRPCRKPAPVKEQTQSRDSVESTTQKAKSTIPPPHISLPEQLSEPCEKPSPAREQVPSRVSVERTSQKDKSTTPPDTSLPEQPPRECEKSSPAREQAPSRASVESITQRDKSTTPPYGLLPEQFPKEGRRPYVFVPKPIPFSKEPTKEEMDRIQHEQRSANSVKLSTDTRLGWPLPLNETLEEEEPRQRLELLPQTSSKNMDWDRPLSSKVLEESNIDQFFKAYAQHTGIPLSTLTTLTFNATFGNRETLVVHKSRGEKAWKRLKKRLDSLLVEEQKDSPDEDVFEVWVKFG